MSIEIKILLSIYNKYNSSFIYIIQITSKNRFVQVTKTELSYYGSSAKIVNKVFFIFTDAQISVVRDRVQGSPCRGTGARSPGAVREDVSRKSTFFD